MSEEKRKWVSYPRCGVILKVREGRIFMLQPGEYPCTMKKGHDQGKNPTPHRSVVEWKNIPK